MVEGDKTGSTFDEVDESIDENSNEEEALVDDMSLDDSDVAAGSVDEEADEEVVVESNSGSESEVDEGSRSVETCGEEVDDNVEVTILLDSELKDVKEPSDEESGTEEIPWLPEDSEYEDAMAEETTAEVSVVFGSIVEEGS